MESGREGRSKVGSERGPGRNFDLYETAAIPEVFADGSSGAMFGPVISRLFFHRVIEIQGIGPDQIETREKILNLVMPTAQLLEFCIGTINSIASSKDQISSIFDIQKDQFLKLVNSQQRGPS